MEVDIFCEQGGIFLTKDMELALEALISRCLEAFY
jgi:hypothetical protein